VQEKWLTLENFLRERHANDFIYMEKPISTTAQHIGAINWVILGVLSLIWGSSFILIKKGLDVFPYHLVGAIRVSAAFLCLFPIALIHFRKIPATKWKYIIAMGILGNFLPAFLFAKAQTQLPSSLTGVLNALTPLTTMLVGIAAFGNNIPKKAQILGLVVAFAGSALLSLSGGNGEIGSFNFYVVFVVTASICYAISTNIIKAHLTSIPSIWLTAMALSVVGPLGMGYVFTSDFFVIMKSDPGAWEALGYLVLLGVVGTAIALVLFNKMIQNTSAVFASTVTYIIPGIAVTWGVLDGESLFPVHYFAIVTILIGVYFANHK
jgi:drug/metabolite transporter (DMT)-like permease